MSFVNVERTPIGIKLVIGEDTSIRMTNEEAEELSDNIRSALKIEERIQRILENVTRYNVVDYSPGHAADIEIEPSPNGKYIEVEDVKKSIQLMYPAESVTTKLYWRQMRPSRQEGCNETEKETGTGNF